MTAARIKRNRLDNKAGNSVTDTFIETTLAPQAKGMINA